MKALRFSLLAVLMSVFVLAYADNDPNKTQKSPYTKISLAEACNSRSFVHSIYMQVDESILREGENYRLIYAKVRHGKAIYLVFGKYREWKDFFHRDGGLLGPPDMKSEAR